MEKVKEQSVDQRRWDQYGLARIEEIKKNPDRYIIYDYPIGDSAVCDEVIKLLKPMRGKTILELGCGRGDFSVWMAKQGAKVTAIDLGQDLIAAARVLCKLNQVDCEFRVQNIIDLPFDSDTFDLVIGISILHHLSETDVSKALRQSRRVLKDSGIVRVLASNSVKFQGIFVYVR